MVKKIIISSCLMLICLVQMVAQQECDDIRPLVESSIYLIRQDYALQSTKDSSLYGRNNKRYYGRVYHVAILSKDTLWFESRLSTPWEADQAFNSKYKADSANYKPVLTDTYTRCLGDANAEFVEALDFKAVVDESRKDISWVEWKTSNVKTIANVRESRLPAGCVVWVKKGNCDGDTCNVTLSFQNVTVQFDDKSREAPIKSTTIFLPPPVGGVFFTKESDVGSLTVKFAGLVMSKGLSYKLLPLPEIARLTSINTPKSEKKPKLETPKASEPNKSDKKSKGEVQPKVDENKADKSKIDAKTEQDKKAKKEAEKKKKEAQETKNLKEN
jgi:hypothetical protein